MSQVKRAHKALLTSDLDSAARTGQLAAMFEVMADGVLILDHEGRILWSNAADTQMFRLDLLPGAAPRSISERGQLLNVRNESAEPLPQAQWPGTRVLAGETLRGADAVDMTVHALDGREVVCNVSGAPIRDAQGQVVGGVMILRDVTAQRRLGQQTREALTALLAMGERLVADPADLSMELTTGTTDLAQRLATLTGAVLRCQRVTIVPIGPNAEVRPTWAIAGPIAQVERRQWQASSPQPDQRHLHDYLPPTIITRLQLGEIIPIDRRLPPFDSWPNPMGWRSMLLVPMRLSRQLAGVLTLDFGLVEHQCTPEEMALAGGVARLAALVLERERLLREREAERAKALAMTEANRRMDEFLSIATHELKTPVTSSSLSVGLAALRVIELRAWLTDRDAAQRSLSAADEQARLVAAAQDLLASAEMSLDRLQRLVVDLLDVSRIRAGKLEMRPALFDLATVAREAVEEQRLLAPGRIIRLRIPLQRQAPVFADADRIRQVITNFLTNALKYAPVERPVDVRMTLRGGWVRVSVRDEGPGLPRAEHQHIWERFHRVEGIPVVGGAGIGLGLGLHIGKTIVEQHRGRIGVRSAPGKGAAFWFALPLAERPEE